MARYTVFAGIVLVMLAGAHAAPDASRRLLASKSGKAAAAPAPAPADEGISLDGMGLEPVNSAVPASISNFDISGLAPLLPLLDPKLVDPALLAELINLLPIMNVTWAKGLLPYLDSVDPDKMGQLVKDAMPALEKADPKFVGELGSVLPDLNAKTVMALMPAIAALQPEVGIKLIASVNAMAPDALISVANLATAISPQVWDSLISLVKMGVPALNFMGAQLARLPFDIPAGAPYSGGPSNAKFTVPINLG